MQNVQIETLSPVHIGSGIDLQGNFEYLHFEGENCLVVIDEHKVLDIIGEDQLNQWVACIEKGESLLSLIQQRQPSVRATDVAQRIIPLSKKGIKEQKTVREQLHSGNGQALLPGSSLKGAIRTAVWANCVFDNPNTVSKGDKLGRKKFDKQNKPYTDFKDETLMQEFFGRNPNEDILRLLQVGDAAFDTTHCFKTEVINLQHNKTWQIKESITQYVEAIPTGQKATLRVGFLSNLKYRAGHLFNDNADLIEPERLFELINEHTRAGISNDLDYYENDAKSSPAFGDYIENLNNLMDKIDLCDHRTCIVRLGYGTGYRNMTGDWQSILNDKDYFDLIRFVRPKHDDRLLFPKTCRFVAGGMPLGFVRLTLQ